MLIRQSFLELAKAKSKIIAEKSNSQSIRKKNKPFDLDLVSCRGDDELKTCLVLVKRAVFGSKMIVNNVSVTQVFCIVAHNNVGRARLAALMLWFINISLKKNMGTSPELLFWVHGYELMPPAMN